MPGTSANPRHSFRDSVYSPKHSWNKNPLTLQLERTLQPWTAFDDSTKAALHFVTGKILSQSFPIFWIGDPAANL